MVLMTNIIATITFFLILNVVQCQKCSSPEITESEFEFLYENDEHLELDFSDEVIKIFPMVNTKSVNSTINNDFSVKYIDARMDGNNLEIFTTDDFKDYAKKERNKAIILQITFICDDSSFRQLVFKQNIADTNVYSPEFSQLTYEIKLSLPLYKGYDLTNFQEISAQDYDIFNNNVHFSSELSNIFEVRTNEMSPDGKTSYASVILLRELLVLEDDVEFSILASDNGIPVKSSSARVVITSNPDYSLPPKPRFQKPIYNGHLNNDLNLNLEQIILDENSFSNEVKLTLDGGDSDLFELSNESNIVTIDLKRELVENDLFNKTFMTFVVIASIPGIFDDKTTVIITFSLSPKPRFQKPIYYGNFNNDLNLDLEQIIVVEKSFSNEVKLELEGGDYELFELSNEYNILTIDLKNELSENDLFNKTFMTFMIVASVPGGFDDKTSVIITYSSSPKPLFQKPVYYGNLNNDLNLNLEQIILDEKSFSNEVKFTLEEGDYDLFKLSNEYNILTIDLKRKLLENDLFNKTFMTFMVIASVPGGFDDKTTVIITFPQRVTGTVKKSLYISHLDENEDQEQDVMSNKNDDCEFIIVDMFPNDREYVKINTERHMIIAQYLDYESIEFSNMLVPQIQVQLQLKCPETGEGIPITNEIELLDKNNVFENRSLVLTNDIGHYSDKSILSIIINDMNDNIPYFIYPPHDDFLIGYPEPSVASELLPKCVIQVEALDQDSGLNAAIKYDIEDNDYFWVDHNTGAIQPYFNALEESKSIAVKVYARDRLGENGNTNSTMINIKIFESKHLLLLRISNETLNMTEFIKNLKEQTLLNVYLLQSAIITSKPDLGRMDRKVTAKAWVYAFDENENFIVNNDLKSEINKLENGIEIISKIYSEVKEPKCIQNVCEQLATTGFIIAISTLSVILGSVILTFIGVWWCFWRPTSATCKSFLNPNNDWQSKFNDSDCGSSIVDPEQGTNHKEDHNKELNTPQLGSLNDLNGERRKSQSTVTFNQLVKRIDINVDDEDHEQYDEKL